MVGMAWLAHPYRWRGGGSVLTAAVGSKGVLDLLRLNYCLLGGRREILTNLLLNFNDENKRFRKRARGMGATWPREYPAGAAQGFLRQHKDHPLEAARVWRDQADAMIDHARHIAQYHGNPVSVVLTSLSCWAGHTPIAQYFSPRLAQAFPNPAVRIGLIEVPTEPAPLENLRDLGTAYPDPEALGLHTIIVTKRPPDDVESQAQDWSLAFGLAVLIGSRQVPIVHQPAAGDVLASLARFSKGFVRADFGLERVPLLPWPFPFGPFRRISRLPLAHEVGTAIARAIRNATDHGADGELPWLLTVGVPLDQRSPLWRHGQLPSEALEHAADILRLPHFPTNIQVIWSTLMAVPEYDRYHAPVATMVLWPSQSAPDALIAEQLDKPSLLQQAEAPSPTPVLNGTVPELAHRGS